jgi:PAS domain S-box-containing protein
MVRLVSVCGELNVAHSVKLDRYLVPATRTAGTWITTSGAALTIALAYFLAAQLGLSLLAKPSDVAVFWPASGLAVAILIAAGRQAGLAVVLGVVLGTFAANLLSDRSLSTSILKGFCNAGEAVLVALLLERWFGRPSTFGDFPRVLGFFGAAALATATSAVGGAAIMTQSHAAAPVWDVWRTWFLSDAVGIVVVGPLLIELSQLRRELRAPGEVLEAVGVLAVLGLASTYVAFAPTGSWPTFSPVCIVLLLLVWLAARVHRIFAIAGALFVSLTVICATTLGIGHFGDGSVPTLERIQGAQATVTMVTVFALVLSALFAERRRSEAELKQSNNRLQLALDCAELGTWSLHLNTSRFQNDERDRHIRGHGQEGEPKTLGEMRSEVHPDDLSRLDAAFAEMGHASGGSCGTQYRLAPRIDEERDGRERWVAMEGTVVRRANARPEQLLGVTHDITERTHAEDALRQREAELGEAQRLAHIGSWHWEAETDVVIASDELLRIFGLDPAIDRAPTLGEQRGRWYPDADWKRMKAAVKRTMQTGVSSELELQAFRKGAPIWVTARGEVVRNSNGQIVGLRGTIQDITDRKQSELTLAERNVQLALAAKAALVGSYAYDVKTRMLEFSEGYAAIFDLPEGTCEMTGSRRRALVHPEDLERLDRVRRQAFKHRRSEFSLEYRNILPRRGVRWIESRSSIFYGSDGHPQRVVGVNIDITERKRTEQALTERNMQLALAGRAALVGNYVYDVNKGTMQISQGYATIHGLPEGTTETTISEWRARVHPDDLARAEGLREQAFADQRKEDNAEYRLVLSTGEVRWIERRGSISYDEVGRPERVVGVNIDVTERKRAEQALVERNILLALAGRAARVGTFAYDTDAEILQISEDYAAIHGLPGRTAKIARSEWLAGVHPQDVERVELPRSEAFRDQRNEYSAEFRIIRPGGEIRWVEIRCFITYDANGHPKRVVGVSIDVTDRKQAELRLAERNAQFGLAQKAARVGTYSYDNIARTMQLSEASAAILGLPQGTSEITADDWRSRVHPDDVQRLAAERRHAFKERQPELVGELRIIQPTGEVRWIEARALITYGGTGRPCSMIGVYIDVTERRRAEDHKNLLIAELDHRVKNTLATVSAVVSHTRQGSRSVADFAATLEGRLRSMAATHELLSDRRWLGISLANLVRRELAPYANRYNIKISGPYVVLRPEAGQAIAMVIHELTTNAAKHGALSTKNGRVSIQWDRGLNGHPRQDLVLEWQEIGGPPVNAPGNSGYGTSTIRDLIPYEFGGTVDLVFAQEGVRCRLKLPAGWLSDAGDPESGALADADAK